MPEIVIRRMTLSDADSVHAIEAVTFAMPWSLDSFIYEMTENKCARYLVADLSGTVVGYAGVHIVLDEGHITNVAIAKEYRRQGIGVRLVRGLMQYAANLGVQYMMLEVRKGNQAAQALYESLGFQIIGVRRKYYENNGEDALIMACDTLPPALEDFSEDETVRE